VVSGAARVTDGSDRLLSVGRNENRYGFLRADNAMNIVLSADLVFTVVSEDGEEGYQPGRVLPCSTVQI